jgi:multicomponent Na+:H+ antiporter subunit D
MSAILIAPILIPLAAALLALLFPRPSLARRVGVSLVFLVLLGLSGWLAGHVQVTGPLVLSWGGWVVPYGIVLVVDTLAAIMLCLSSLTGLTCVLYGFAETPKRGEHPLRLPLLLLLVVGIHIAFLTGDLFNLFVAFEVLLLASYALMTVEADGRHSRPALPYVTINLLGSALFLCACAFTYGLFGTLNFAEIAVRSSAMGGDVRVGILGLMLLVVFALKAGIFPLYYWLPVSYPDLPPPIAAFYAGMLTKVGVYVLLRVFGTVLPPDLTWLHTALAWAAGFTMIVGVLGAVAQNRIQRILSYHIVSQVGYMALAIGLFSPFAFAAAIFYVIHHIVVKSSLFLAGGVILRVQGTDDLNKTGGLWEAAPGLSLVFLVQALSLAGVPPFSGFWGKLMIVEEALSQRQRQWALVLLALIASILTLLSMLKIWLGAFWRAAPTGSPLTFSRSSRGMTAAVGLLAATSLGIGLGANRFVELAEHAARETLDRQGYIRHVQALNRQPEEGKHP